MPIPPTPNGRLHLGHIAGPYLRMDMLCRYLRSQGHHVRVVSAVDGFDSYVLWKGLQETRPPEEVCRDYHAQIARDLAALDIEVDDFLDLVQGSHAPSHANTARRAVEMLVASGHTDTIVEKVLYSRATGRYLVGAWLTGQCPQCEAPAAGYFCEACGAHFRPESMLNPGPRMGDADLEWRETENIFLRVPDEAELLRRLQCAGAPEKFIAVVLRFLARERGLVRLTAPGDWGVAWPADRWGNPRVLFEAGWEYGLTCGERYAQMEGGDAHPMARGSDVTTLVSFGIDNAVLLLAGSVAVMNALPERQPFDHVLTNYFYNLQGSKFSTSRLHVVWAADIVDMTPASSDAVRCFLARESPEEQTSNFDVGDFIRFVNDDLAGTMQARIDAAWETLARSPQREWSMSASMAGRFEASSSALDHAFRLDAVSARAACAVLLAWDGLPQVDLGNPEEAYGWLKGLAYFAAPIMPRLSSELWRALGHEGMPLRREVRCVSTPHMQGNCRAWFSPLSLESLSPCLPAGLSLAGVASHA
ncbi:methionine--tRNA ligase [Paraburkholderia fungorum]|nr:methionine--tRNA ligase [Paraburkholderia fungorum]ACD14710.1 Methionine--tRNA ligase [Paraburkholderia phytofirmans PsJN]MDR8399110.1 methionine--tRNA ligase [Paraburkholderia sp. USG1]PZX02477.1 methionyl-tRNA synthetase [Burkholderia sp. 28_3]RAS54669.1 methionyl-tRNA synthetase [Burkholderia cenocepacia]USU16464.1 methionine--tRNA ligase [Paraburkholderia fungorum]